MKNFENRNIKKYETGETEKSEERYVCKPDVREALEEFLLKHDFIVKYLKHSYQ